MSSIITAIPARRPYPPRLDTRASSSSSSPRARPWQTFLKVLLPSTLLFHPQDHCPRSGHRCHRSPSLSQKPPYWSPCCQPPCWSWSDISRMLSYHVLFLLKTLWSLPTALRMNPTSLAGLAGPPCGLAPPFSSTYRAWHSFCCWAFARAVLLARVPSSRSTFLHAGDSCTPSLIPHGCRPLQEAFNLCSPLKSCLLNHPQAWGSCPNSVLPQNPELITC